MKKKNIIHVDGITSTYISINYGVGYKSRINFFLLKRTLNKVILYSEDLKLKFLIKDRKIFTTSPYIILVDYYNTNLYYTLLRDPYE